MHDTASFEIKALLTLALLKSGTSAKDIQTAVDVASTARLMIIEEYAELARRDESDASDSNVTRIYETRQGAPAPRRLEPQQAPQVEGVNSDIKALLSLLLLQHGASQKEISTTLRLAAAARAAENVEKSDEAAPERVETQERPERVERTAKPEPRDAEKRVSAKQAMRNDFLAAIPRTV